MTKCKKVNGGQVCRYLNCVNAAACVTNIYGFRVLACRKHHTCAATRNESPLD